MTSDRQPIVPPTDEQMRRAAFVEEEINEKKPGRVTITIGKAYRRVRMLEILSARGFFSESEVKALATYRRNADLADRSPVRDSLGRMMPHPGDSDGPTVRMLNARIIRDDCERAAGSLADILRAVMIDDMSLTEWAIGKAGGIEKCRMRNGESVCRIEAPESALRIAQLEIKMAAKRLQAELDT